MVNCKFKPLIFCISAIFLVQLSTPSGAQTNRPLSPMEIFNSDYQLSYSVSEINSMGQQELRDVARYLAACEIYGISEREENRNMCRFEYFQYRNLWDQNRKIDNLFSSLDITMMWISLHTNRATNNDRDRRGREQAMNAIGRLVKIQAELRNAVSTRNSDLDKRR